MNRENKIEKILDKKINDDCSVSYLIKWVGLPNNMNSWENYTNLTSFIDKINEFEYDFNRRLKNNEKNPTISCNNTVSPCPSSSGKIVEENLNIDPTTNEIINPVNIPEKLLKIKAVNNNLYFYVKWLNDDKESIESYKWIRDNYPYLLIAFFENRIKLGGYIMEYNIDTNEYKLKK